MVLYPPPLSIMLTIWAYNGYEIVILSQAYS